MNPRHSFIKGAAALVAMLVFAAPSARAQDEELATLRKQKRYEEALQRFSSLDQAELSAQDCYTAGACAEALGLVRGDQALRRQAFEHYQRCIELDPTLSFTQNPNRLHQKLTLLRQEFEDGYQSRSTVDAATAPESVAPPSPLDIASNRSSGLRGQSSPRSDSSQTAPSRDAKPDRADSEALRDIEKRGMPSPNPPAPGTDAIPKSPAPAETDATLWENPWLRYGAPSALGLFAIVSVALRARRRDRVPTGFHYPTAARDLRVDRQEAPPGAQDPG